MVIDIVRLNTEGVYFREDNVHRVLINDICKGLISVTFDIFHLLYTPRDTLY